MCLVVPEPAVFAEREYRFAFGGEFLDLVSITVDDPDKPVTIDVAAVGTDEGLVLGEFT